MRNQCDFEAGLPFDDGLVLCSKPYGHDGPHEFSVTGWIEDGRVVTDEARVRRPTSCPPSTDASAAARTSIEARVIDALRMTRTEIAELVGRSRKTLYDYRWGEKPVPPTVRRRLVALLGARAERLQHLALQLEKELLLESRGTTRSAKPCDDTSTANLKRER